MKAQGYMSSKYATPTLVVNIKRQFFAAILSQPRRQFIEHRALSDYWVRRLEKAGKPPFNLRMLNGMTPPVPEATIQVIKVVRSKKNQEIELHLGRVLDVKHWDRKKERPTK
jgi:hypothetical protein